MFYAIKSQASPIIICSLGARPKLLLQFAAISQCKLLRGHLGIMGLHRNLQSASTCPPLLLDRILTEATSNSLSYITISKISRRMD